MSLYYCDAVLQQEKGMVGIDSRVRNPKTKRESVWLKSSSMPSRKGDADPLPCFILKAPEMPSCCRHSLYQQLQLSCQSELHYVCTEVKMWKIGHVARRSAFNTLLCHAVETAFTVTFGRAGEDNKKFKLGNVESTLQGFAGADYQLQARANLFYNYLHYFALLLNSHTLVEYYHALYPEYCNPLLWACKPTKIPVSFI